MDQDTVIGFAIAYFIQTAGALTLCGMFFTIITIFASISWYIEAIIDDLLYQIHATDSMTLQTDVKQKIVKFSVTMNQYLIEIIRFHSFINV